MTTSTPEQLLHQACINGDFTEVERLMEEINDISEYPYKNKIFEDTLNANHFDVADYLIDHNIDPDYNHALNMMIRYQNLEAFQHLVENHNVEITTDNVRYAFIYKGFVPNYDILNYIVDKGFDIHYNDDEAFEMAKEFNILDNLKFLIEGGHVNEDNMRRLFIDAAVYNYIDTVKFIYDNNYIDPNDSCIQAAQLSATNSAFIDNNMFEYLSGIQINNII